MKEDGSCMSIIYTFLRVACLVTVILAFSSGQGLAECTDWLRQVALPKLGCSPQAIEEICAGQRPVPTTPYCGGSEQPPANTGDWCMTPVGGCALSAPVALNAECQCPSPAGYVKGWVSRQ
jgi:hypothetical protein